MTSVEAFRGLHYPNKIGRLCFMSLEEVMGQNGVKALLRLAELDQYLDAYPPNDLKREFPFEAISQYSVALGTMYGQRGARGFGTHGVVGVAGPWLAERHHADTGDENWLTQG